MAKPDSPSSSTRGGDRPQPALSAQAILLVGLLAFVGIVWIIDRVRGSASVIGPLGAIAMSLVPAILWLTYFYMRDIHEPEPTHYVVGVFLLGALVAAPLATYITDAMFKVPAWGTLPRWGLNETVAAFLVIAPAQEMMKYVVVRYSVYLSAEFDEPMDGIVYMTAAGLGFATAWNVAQMTRAPQIELTTAAVNAVTITLAQASFSGVLGYVLGRAKFIANERRAARLLAAALAATIALSGGFTLLENLVTRRGLDYYPSGGLAMAAVFAVVVFAILHVLTNRHLARSPHKRRAVAS